VLRLPCSPAQVSCHSREHYAQVEAFGDSHRAHALTVFRRLLRVDDSPSLIVRVK
jgi:hypothetical protein